MAFVARNRQTIRTSLLNDWAARYAALNPSQSLSIVTGSDAYIWADAIALELENTEAQAQVLTREILPDQADTDYLNRHGVVNGVARDPAIPWTGIMKISGPPSATVTFGTSVLTYNGISYGSFKDISTGAPITFVVLGGFGGGGMRATANIPGSITSLPDGAVLTWSSAPANTLSTASVATTGDFPAGGTITPGEDQESDASYAQRIIAKLQSRPASGNRADWQAWCEAFAGVLTAYVYPLYSHALSAANTLGCVTVVPIGPVATDANGNQNGDNPVNSRIISGGTATSIGGYIEGTNDSTGAPPGPGVTLPQLRPVTMAVGDYTIIAPTPAPQAVEMHAIMGANYAYPFAYSATDLVIGSPTPTNTTFSIAGNQTARYAANGASGPGHPIIVKALNGSASVVRGNYCIVTPTNVVYNGGTTNTDITIAGGFPLSGVPVVASVVCPAPPQWQTLRLAVFQLFDSLGPGDTSPTSRWPAPGNSGPSTLYQASLVTAVQDQFDSLGRSVRGEYNSLGVLVPFATGVVNAAVINPSTDIVPSPFNLVTLSDFFVHI